MAPIAITIRKGYFLMFHDDANYYCPLCNEYTYIDHACLKEYGISNFVFNKNFNIILWRKFVRSR